MLEVGGGGVEAGQEVAVLRERVADEPRVGKDVTLAMPDGVLADAAHLRENGSERGGVDALPVDCPIRRGGDVERERDHPAASFGSCAS